MSAAPPKRRGVALLTVMLLIAVMSAVAVGIVDDIRFGLRRSGNNAALAQARWYALGAEAAAIGRLKALAERDPNRTTLEGDWHGRTLSFPIEGGEIATRLTDGGNCYNLNALGARQTDEEGVAPETAAAPARAQFLLLLATLDVSRADATRAADALMDWIDQDQTRIGQGGEDEAYAKLDPTYRTGGTLLAEVSEARAALGVDAELYAAMRPFVCALPTSGGTRINVNTLQIEQAPLLVMLGGGRLSLAAAREAIARRPAGGWADAEAFWNEPLLSRVAPTPPDREAIVVRSRYFALETNIRYLDAELTASALLEQDSLGGAKVRARRWTKDE